MRGEVVYLYAFDVANEIATQMVKEILASKPFPFEIRTIHTAPRDASLYRPLAVELPALPVRLAGRPVHVLVRVYSVGVVSIAMRVPVEFGQLPELAAFHRPVLEDGRPLDSVARQLCADVCRGLHDALVEDSAPSDPEAYTVFCLTDLGGDRETGPWLERNRRTIAELLTEAQPDTLSEMQIGESLRIKRSYSNSDLILIDWDAALAVDLNGYVEDVLYVLELANLQLEEYRMMDRRLDHYLDRAYEDLKRRRFGLLGTYSKRLSTLRLFRVDVTKLNDEVTHISKFFGDWYLARVYLGAGERFYLNQWRQSVEDRLGQLDELYNVVNSDVNNRRMAWLEVLIVVLIALELILPFIKK